METIFKYICKHHICALSRSLLLPVFWIMIVIATFISWNPSMIYIYNDTMIKCTYEMGYPLVLQQFAIEHGHKNSEFSH